MNDENQCLMDFIDSLEYSYFRTEGESIVEVRLHCTGDDNIEVDNNIILSKIEPLREVRRLTIDTEFSPLSRDGLLELRNWKALEECELAGYPGINSEDFSQLISLNDFPNLKMLHILFQGEIATGLKAISKVTSLEDLRIEEANICDEDLLYFVNLRHLRSIYLPYCELTGYGIKHLGRLESLSELSVIGSPINNEGLEAISRMKRLTELGISGETFDDEGVRWISDLENLTRLEINGERVTDYGIAHLEGLKTLEHLDLSCTKVSDQSIDAILELKKLEGLVLTNTEISKKGIKKLQQGLPECEIWSDHIPREYDI